jgi:hypothetical protein
MLLSLLGALLRLPTCPFSGSRRSPRAEFKPIAASPCKTSHFASLKRSKVTSRACQKQPDFSLYWRSRVGGALERYAIGLAGI